jgi:tetratricopeptide (TPR) repeat protein
MNRGRNSLLPATDHPESVALPASIASRYQVLEELGRGGMAVVYRVRERNAACDVALKQLTPHRSDRDVSALFEHEFSVLAELRHPSVIEVYDYGIDQAAPYYTMELLDGGDLTTLAPLPFVSACQLMIQVCSSLSLLHSRQLVHRDISPRNVRRTRAGVTKLIDFGAMAHMGPCTHSVGTPGFVAPEVVHHLNLDARTDLFSVGATLYYALTGGRAFAGQTFADLNDSWGHEPVPPGQLVTGIPKALDELVLALLRIDPARRPRSAFEVMQRLAAIAGVAYTASETISRAYLATPTLTGRNVEQRRFRQCLRKAAHAAGGGLLFEGASGVGRSRLLDRCVLEAKTTGATVLRLNGRAARPEAFWAAHQLAEQLLQSQPETVRPFTHDPAAFATLFHGDPVAANSALSVAPRAQLHAQRDLAQPVLIEWFLSASRSCLLVIAVDDLERIDEPSVALLVALLHGSSACRLLLLGTLQTPLDEHAALAVLRQRCVSISVEPLTSEQTEVLFASVFCDAPNVALVSARIHQIAAGRPREAIALARYLLEQGRVHYTDGNWVLPTELSLADLPASAEDMLHLRIADLSPLARHLVEAQALALDSAWLHADYCALDVAAETVRVDEAIATLEQHGVLVHDGDMYTLSQRGAAAWLLGQLTPAAAMQQHRVLADLCVRRGKPGLFEVHHLLLADHAVQALDRLVQLVGDTPSAVSLQEASSLHFKAIAEIMQRAHAAALSEKRRPREINELSRLLLELSIATDSSLYARYAASWREQLERDTGLSDYWASSASLPEAERLANALQSALARSNTLPETERVYRLEEAIKYLAHYVAISIAIGSRTCDTRLLASLPNIMAPLAALSPLLYALWQNTIAVTETVYKAQFEQARLRLLDVYARLEGVSNRDVPYVDAIRFALAHAVSGLEITLGYTSVERWLQVMDQSALQRGNALFLRRVLCLFEGDALGAERFRKQAEVLTLAANARQMFDAPLTLELMAHVHAGDLAGIKQVAENIARRATNWPGWVAQRHLAYGYYQQLRGDLPTAKAEFERVLAMTDPDTVDPPPALRIWVNAVAGYITVLTDLGSVEEACRFGVAACERSVALGISGAYAHTRALAIAEAKLGSYESAAERLDQIIAERAGRNSALLAVDLEARVRVAIWAKDSAAAQRYTQLVAQTGQLDTTSVQLSRRGRLLDAAKRAGIELAVPASGFESIVLGNSLRPVRATTPPKLVAALESLRDPASRAQRTLDLLCSEVNCERGQLYRPRGAELVLIATLGQPLEAALDGFVQGYYRQQLKAAAMSTVFTSVARPQDTFNWGSWTSPTGKPYCIVLLQPAHTDQCWGVLAMLGTASALRTPAMGAVLHNVVGRLSEFESD